jgi:transcriptional regulator with XRE-family HTH domain
VSNEFTRDPRLADGIGRVLIETREAAGIKTAKELASITGLTAPRISRIETGKVRPRPDEIEKWFAALAANSGPGLVLVQPASGKSALLQMLAEYDLWRADFDKRISYGVAGDELAYTGTFKATKTIKTFAAAELPSFLQTEAYARAVIAAAAPDADEDEREEAVGARLERSGFLDDPSKQFQIVLAETALRWLLCDPDSMRAQIGRLYDLLKPGHIELFVIPLKARLDTPARQGFTIHDDQFVVVDMFGGAVTFRQQEPKRYEAHLKRLLASAVGGDDVRGLLAAAMGAIPKR